MTIAALIQLPLGADPVVLAIAMASTGLGLFAFLALGAYNLGAWVVLLYTLGNVMVALYAKTALGQPLDSHSTPVMSFLVLLAIDTAMTLYTLAAATSLIGERPWSFLLRAADIRPMVHTCTRFSFWQRSKQP